MHKDMDNLVFESKWEVESIMEDLYKIPEEERSPATKQMLAELEIMKKAW